MIILTLRPAQTFIFYNGMCWNMISNDIQHQLIESWLKSFMTQMSLLLLVLWFWTYHRLWWLHLPPLPNPWHFDHRCLSSLLCFVSICLLEWPLLFHLKGNERWYRINITKNKLKNIHQDEKMILNTAPNCFSLRLC